MIPKPLLYFAYGSNMNDTDLQRWCKKGDVKVHLKNPRVARLINYSLKFTHKSVRRGGGVADIVKSNEEVWGILFETDEESLKNLDKKEMAGIIYQRIKVIADVNNAPVGDVVTYEVIKKEPCAPSKEYLNIILEGARQHNLPEGYFQEISSVPTCN